MTQQLPEYFEYVLKLDETGRIENSEYTPCSIVNGRKRLYHPILQPDIIRVQIRGDKVSAV